MCSRGRTRKLTCSKGLDDKKSGMECVKEDLKDMKKMLEFLDRRERRVEEAWRLFERQPGFKRKTREGFEEEFTRKVRNVMSTSREEQEKTVQKWSSETQRVVQPEERRSEARERTRMEQEEDNEHGREYCDRGSSSHRRSLRQGTELRRQAGRRARCTGLLSADNLMFRIPQSAS